VFFVCADFLCVGFCLCVCGGWCVFWSIPLLFFVWLCFEACLLFWLCFGFFACLFLSGSVFFCRFLSLAMLGVWAVPLTEAVSFKVCLERGCRVMVPKAVRVRFGLDPGQVLLVMVSPLGAGWGWETFYGKVDKSGRITIPKLTLSLLQSRAGEQSLMGAAMEVSIEPA
jgi:bifunctional DNA-binding transcriptional regulator/antitoxin component of YhaV-PrlF toxin-antitoxin module